MICEPVVVRSTLSNSQRLIAILFVSNQKKQHLGRRTTSREKHVELMALRWFNPATHEWNIDFATPNVGTLGAVPGVGEFKNGRVDFYNYEPINGRSVLVRFSMWSITADTAQSEQAFSEDGGKTWEVNWINKYTRVKDE